jgi:hypothetical protein
MQLSANRRGAIAPNVQVYGLFAQPRFWIVYGG